MIVMSDQMIDVLTPCNLKPWLKPQFEHKIEFNPTFQRLYFVPDQISKDPG